MIYIALLRGINVGGNNKVNMKALKTTFEQAGMQHVLTYINSGNIIFSHPTLAHAELSQILQQAIATEFALQIKVMIRDIHQIQSIIQAIPASWTNNDQMKSDIFFLWEEIDSPSIVQQLPLKAGVGTLLYTAGALLFSVDREDAVRSQMNKLVGSKIYPLMTIRNVNTTRKIFELMQAVQEEVQKD